MDVVSRSSQMPCAIFAMMLAVAGQTRNRSAMSASEIWVMGLFFLM